MKKINISIKSNKMTWRQYVDLCDRKDADLCLNCVGTMLRLEKEANGDVDKYRARVDEYKERVAK